MKKLICTLFVTLVGFTASADIMDYANPIIGTNGMGHTFPGACAPFGIVQLSPETDTIPHNVGGKYQPKAYEYCAGYQYRDKTIVGEWQALRQNVFNPQPVACQWRPGVSDDF